MPVGLTSVLPSDCRFTCHHRCRALIRLDCIWDRGSVVDHMCVVEHTVETDTNVVSDPRGWRGDRVTVCLLPKYDKQQCPRAVEAVKEEELNLLSPSVLHTCCLSNYDWNVQSARVFHQLFGSVDLLLNAIEDFSHATRAGIKW